MLATAGANHRSGGRRADELAPYCGSSASAARNDNGYGLDNDEQGVPIWVCRDLRKPWSQLWPELRHLG